LNWKGGYLTPDGYVKISVDGHQIHEHRFVMEQSIGRKLNPSEFIHHLNGIRNDNRIENLQIVSSDTHERRTLVKILYKRIHELEDEVRILKNK
jgi:hypothetical protein